MVLGPRVIWVKLWTYILSIFSSKMEKICKCNFANNFLIFCHIFMKFGGRIHFSNTNDTKCHKIHKRSPNFTKCCQISHNFDLASTLSAFLINWHAIWQVVTFFRYKCHYIFFVDFIAKNKLLLFLFIRKIKMNIYKMLITFSRFSGPGNMILVLFQWCENK